MGGNPDIQEQHAAGLVAVELIPQGTLAERIPAGGAHIRLSSCRPASAPSSPKARRRRAFRHRRAPAPRHPGTALVADFAFIRARRADAFGNLQFRGTTRNFQLAMAMAAATTIVEADELSAARSHRARRRAPAGRVREARLRGQDAPQSDRVPHHAAAELRRPCSRSRCSSGSRWGRSSAAPRRAMARATLALVGDVNFRGLERATGIFDAVRPLPRRGRLRRGQPRGAAARRSTPTATRQSTSRRTRAWRRCSGLGLRCCQPGQQPHVGSRRGRPARAPRAPGAPRRHGLRCRPRRRRGARRAARRAAHRLRGNGAGDAEVEQADAGRRGGGGRVRGNLPIDALEPLVARLAAERARGCFTMASVHAGRERAALPPVAVRAAFRPTPSRSRGQCRRRTPPARTEGVAPPPTAGGAHQWSQPGQLPVRRPRRGQAQERRARGPACMAGHARTWSGSRWHR